MQLYCTLHIFTVVYSLFAFY